MNEDINIRVLLLPPPGNDNVWEKSIIDIHSHSGSVIVEMAGFFFFLVPGLSDSGTFLTKALTDTITRSREPPFSDVRYVD